MHCPGAFGDSPAGAALDSLASSMELGLLLVDIRRQPVFANRIALDLLCSPSRDLVSAWPGLQAAIGDGPVFTAELMVDGKPRSLRGEIRERGAMLEIFLKDRRRLGALDLELLCASRMKEWVHHCDALVHDANGALNTVQLTLELLDGQWPGPRAGEQAQEPHRRNHADVIRDNLARLKSILRKFAEDPETMPAAPFDAREVLKEAAFILRMPARRRRIELQVISPEVPVTIHASRARVRQALVNIVLARLEGAPERSRITLEAVPTADGVDLMCSDTSGFTDEDRVAIFGVMLSERLAGPVDSLRLARALVEAEGADLDVRGIPSGTAFHFVFPRA